MSVKPKRHLAKAITWRLIASLTTFIIGWIVTGDLNFGMAIGAADVVIKIALYYFHERIWYHSKFGIVNDKQQTINNPILIKKPGQKPTKVKVDRKNHLITKTKLALSNNLYVVNKPEPSNQ